VRFLDGSKRRFQAPRLWAECTGTARHCGSYSTEDCPVDDGCEVVNKVGVARRAGAPGAMATAQRR
jgi:hypothetical protein